MVSNRLRRGAILGQRKLNAVSLLTSLHPLDMKADSRRYFRNQFDLLSFSYGKIEMCCSWLVCYVYIYLIFLLKNGILNLLFLWEERKSYLWWSASKSVSRSWRLTRAPVSIKNNQPPISRPKQPSSLQLFVFIRGKGRGRGVQLMLSLIFRLDGGLLPERSRKGCWSRRTWSIESSIANEDSVEPLDSRLEAIYWERKACQRVLRKICTERNSVFLNDQSCLKRFKPISISTSSVIFTLSNGQ